MRIRRYPEVGPETPIRIAGRSDTATVTRLIGAFRDFLDAVEPSNAVIEAAVSELIEDPGTEFVLIGEPEVGFAQLRYRLSVWSGREDAWLEDLFVVEDARGEGLGRALVEVAIQRARSRGCERVQLETNSENTGAVALYEGAGFSSSHLPERWGENPDLLFTRRL